MVVEDGMSLGQVDDKSSIIFFLKIIYKMDDFLVANALEPSSLRPSTQTHPSKLIHVWSTSPFVFFFPINFIIKFYLKKLLK